jgi:hypothetical protein
MERCCFLGIVVCSGLASAGDVAAQSSPRSYSAVDPYDVPRPAGTAPAVSYDYLWQTDPFGVGYDLLGGFRRIYSGARQPIGHEILPTRPDGNGYVYRPVYAPSPGYRYTPGGALIVEFPARHPTRADTEFPTLGTPTTYYGPPQEVIPQPPPVIAPREF